MPAYQVLVELDNDGQRWTCLRVFEDLAEDALRSGFVEPYLSGVEIPTRWGPLNRSTVRKVWILRTEDGYREALRQARTQQYEAEEEFMRSSGMALPPDMSGDLDMLRFGQDVTRQFLP